jgi:hypothetical protein
MKLEQALPALFIMWINYIFFIIGFNGADNKRSKNVISNKIVIHEKNCWILRKKPRILILLGLMSIVCSMISMEFYTGQNPIEVFSNLFDDISNYYIYQYNFKNILQSDRFQYRYIYSIMILFSYFTLFYGFISFFLSKSKMDISKYIFLFFSIISFLYMGIARGTNFEFFELLILSIFILIIKDNGNRSMDIKLKKILYIILSILLMVYIFFLRVESRGSIFSLYGFSSEIFFDENGWISEISRSIAFVILIPFSYLGFGIQYLSTYVIEVWFNSSLNFIAGLIPFGYDILVGSSISVMMNNLIDIGVKWRPDVVLFIGSIGYIGIVIFCWGLGRISALMENRENQDVVGLFTLFLIFLEMVSLPIGNFVWISSAGKMCTTVLTIYWTFKAIKIKIN